MKKLGGLILLSLTVSGLAGCNSAKEFDITFKNYDNSVLETIKVKEGEMPVYSKGTPARNADKKKTYTFKAWVPTLEKATANAEYIASYDSKAREYTVTFDSDGGSAVNSVTVAYGESVAKPADPTKESAKGMKYTFKYWYLSTDATKAEYQFSGKITSDITLKALWDERVDACVVTFNTNGGSIIEPVEVVKGGLLTKPTDPTHDNDAQYSYTFAGWYDNEKLEGEQFNFANPINSDLTLFAKWNKTDRKYTVTFKNGDEVLETQEVKYGETASYTGETPTKNDDEVGYYTFKEWSPSIEDTIVGDTTFEATYNIEYKYYHYEAKEGSCELPGTCEYWAHYDNIVYELNEPSDVTIIEAGQPTDDQVAAMFAANPSDKRFTSSGGHTYDARSGECIKLSKLKISDDAFNTFDDATNGTQTLTEDSSKTAPKGYGKMYELKHTYFESTTRMNLSHPFKDFDITGYKEISFYINGVNSIEWIFTDDDGLKDNAGSVHPNGSFGDTGIITCKNLGNNSWRLCADGFKFRMKADGAAVASFVVNNRTTMDQLISTPETSSLYSTDKIYISDVYASTEVKCGAYSANGHEFLDISMMEKQTKFSSRHGSMFHYKGDGKVNMFSDMDVTGVSSIKFTIVNEHETNALILKGDASNGQGVICGALTEEIIAIKDGTTWTVSRGSGEQFDIIPSWEKADNYVVENVSKLSDIFSTWTYSSDIYISVIEFDAPIATVGSYITEDVLDMTNLATISEVHNRLGYGYTYKSSSINNLVSAAEFDVTGYEKIEFVVSVINNGSCVMLKNLGGGASNSTGGLYSEAGDDNLITATREGTTWTVTRGNGQFFSLPSWSNIDSYTVENVTYFKDIFNFWSYGSSVIISDIVAF